MSVEPGRVKPATRLTFALLVMLSAVISFGASPASVQERSWWDRTDPGLGRSPPKSRFYTIRSDLPFEVTKACADLLDTMYVEVTRLMQGLRTRGRQHLDVYMFETEHDYRQTLRTRFGVNATGSAGMFFVGPKGAGLAFFIEGRSRPLLEQVVRHEAFHQLAHLFFDGDLPPWVNEGLAEYFGESLVVDGTIIEAQPTPWTIARLKALTDDDRVIPFATLLSLSPRDWNAALARGDASTQYLQSASMVHFLMWGEGGRLNGNFSAYLRHLNDGRDSLSAFRMAFGGTDANAIEDFERRWRAFVAQQTPGSARTAAEQLQFLANGVLFLRDRGIYPRTLEALRDALVEARFEQVDGETVTTSPSRGAGAGGAGGGTGGGGRDVGVGRTLGAHGVGWWLRASDIDLTIPMDQIQDQRRPPEYVLVDKSAAAKGSRGADRNRERRGVRGASSSAKSKSGSRSKPGDVDDSGNDGGGAPESDGTDDPSSDPAGKSVTPPPPPELSTKNLRPRDFRISWSQGPDGRWRGELRLK